jgi:hypothetical protein
MGGGQPGSPDHVQPAGRAVSGASGHPSHVSGTWSPSRSGAGATGGATTFTLAVAVFDVFAIV